MIDQEIITIPIKDLHLWSENPRDPIDVESTDFEIIERAITDKHSKWNLKKLSESMGDFYDFSELPIVVQIDGKYVVYDGNRRIAILKYLQDDTLNESLSIRLFFDNDVSALKNLIEMPCNFCSKEVALISIERKHVTSGSWGTLERDFFLHLHRNEVKSPFMWFDEQTGLISGNPSMNKRYVKDELLTKNNLAKIGFNYSPEHGYTTNYSKEDYINILKKVESLISQKVITTEKNRGEFVKLLTDTPELIDKIKPFDSKKPSVNLNGSKVNFITEVKKRRSSTTKPKEMLFGKLLYLKQGPVNDLYLGIYNIYAKNINDQTILPIIGMSLRLILEVGARIYYEEKGDETANIDQIYKNFLSVARKEMNTSKQKQNLLALTQSWLNKDINIEGLLGKYAHGSINSFKSDILDSSGIVGDILEFYFKRDNS